MNQHTPDNPQNAMRVAAGDATRGKYTSRWLRRQYVTYVILFGVIAGLFVPIFGNYFFILEPAIREKMIRYFYYAYVPILILVYIALQRVMRYAHTFLDLHNAGEPIPVALIDTTGRVLEKMGPIIVGLALGGTMLGAVTGTVLDRFLAPPGVSNVFLILSSGVFFASALSLACYVALRRVAAGVNELILMYRPETKLMRVPLRVKIGWLGLTLVIMPMFMVVSLVYQEAKRHHSEEQLRRLETITATAARLHPRMNIEAIHAALELGEHDRLHIVNALPALLESSQAETNADENPPPDAFAAARDYEAGTATGCLRAGAGYVCATAPWRDDSDYLATQRRLMWIIAAATFVFAAAMSTLISGNIVHAVRHVRTATRRLMSRTTVDIDRVFFTTDDEIADIVDTFNDVLATITTERNRRDLLLDNIQNSVTQLVSDSGDISAVVRDQVTGISEQATSIEETATTATEVAAVTKQIAENIQTVSAMASETLDACRSGAQHIEDAITDIRSSEERVQALRDRIESLATQSESIGEILTMIRGISERSELLSLNASLEAAGVGSEGVRFRVVADEMKRLAAQTRDAAEQIGDIVGHLQNGLAEIVGISLEGMDHVRGSVQQVVTTRSALTNISTLADETSTAAQTIQTSTAELSSASTEMADTLAEISLVANEIRGGADKVTHIVERLGELSDRLATLVRGDDDGEASVH